MCKKKPTTSTKQAAVCQLAGCDLEIEIDPANPGKVLYLLSPVPAAEHAITQFEAGASLPARPLLNTLADLHRETKNFLHKHRQLTTGGGKQIAPEGRD